MKFTIETVSKLTGIPAATLRNWEKRYGFPKPERTPSGHRQYDQRDISFLKEALRQQNEGRNLCDLTAEYECFTLHTENNEVPKSSMTDDVHYRAHLIYDALLRYDIGGTTQQWMILNAKLAPEQLFTLVFEPILRRLGQEWQQGKVSIAQEHFISHFLRMKMGAFLTLDFPSQQTPRIALAALSGETHEGGLLMIGCHLKFRGYPISYFGTDLPVTTLSEALTESKASAVGLSYVNTERLRRDLPEIVKLQIPVILGGIAALAMDKNEREQLMEKNPHVFLCFESSSEKAADFVEFVCRRYQAREENSENSSKIVP